MTGAEWIEVRYRCRTGYAHRTLPAADVPAEVEFLSAVPSTGAIEVRAVGAAEWRQVA